MMSKKYFGFFLVCVVSVAVYPQLAFATVATNLPFIDRLSEVYSIVTGPIVVWLSVGSVIAAGMMFIFSRWFEAFGMVAKLLVGVAFMTGAVAYVSNEYGQSISALIP